MGEDAVERGQQAGLGPGVLGDGLDHERGLGLPEVMGVGDHADPRAVRILDLAEDLVQATGGALGRLRRSHPHHYFAVAGGGGRQPTGDGAASRYAEPLVHRGAGFSPVPPGLAAPPQASPNWLIGQSAN
jgi:hypothetical protein